MKPSILFNTLRDSKRTVKWANTVLVWSGLEIIRTILVFKQTEYNLVTPLIPQYITCEIYAAYVDAGLIVSIGFIPTLILKVYQKNSWVAIIGTVTLITFYLYTWIR